MSPITHSERTPTSSHRRTWWRGRPQWGIDPGGQPSVGTAPAKPCQTVSNSCERSG
jgi:hypothetical protein